MALLTTTNPGKGIVELTRPAEVNPSTTRAPETFICSAIRTAYGPPIARGTIPHVKPFTSNENILVWKHAHGSKHFALPVETSQSVKSPSNSSTHTEGIGSGSMHLSSRTAFTKDSGENAVAALRS